MILTCTSCSSQLQLDDERVPSRSFTVRCPKCDSTVQGHIAEAGASNGKIVPEAERLPSEEASAARPFHLDPDDVDGRRGANARPAGAMIDARELARLLSGFIDYRSGAPKGIVGTTKRAPSRLAWEKHRILICVGPEHRDSVARILAENDYQVFVAERTAEAIESMREEPLDIVILDAEFDVIEQGAAFVRREISALRPADRRRLFVVRLATTGRTQDALEAFINNVNLVVNVNDLEKLPRTLQRSLRNYNELYRDFNTAIGMPEI